MVLALRARSSVVGGVAVSLSSFERLRILSRARRRARRRSRERRGRARHRSRPVARTMTTDSRAAAPRVAARSTLAGRGNECARRASTRERDARGMAAADGVAGTRAMARAVTRAVTRSDARARRAGTRARAPKMMARISTRERGRGRARAGETSCSVDRSRR